jgi:hypothetical protein
MLSRAGPPLSGRPRARRFLARGRTRGGRGACGVALRPSWPGAAGTRPRNRPPSNARKDGLPALRARLRGRARRAGQPIVARRIPPQSRNAPERFERGGFRGAAAESGGTEEGRMSAFARRRGRARAAAFAASAADPSAPAPRAPAAARGPTTTISRRPDARFAAASRGQPGPFDLPADRPGWPRERGQKTRRAHGP